MFEKLAAIAAGTVFLQMVITGAMKRRKRKKRNVNIDDPDVVERGQILDLVWKGKCGLEESQLLTVPFCTPSMLSHG